jgi:tRNA A-37 threonylcarbamoyl transferase component Bud32
MSIVEFVDYTNDNIKIIDNEDINHPYESFFDENEEGEEYEIKKIYYGTELLPSTINIGDCIYEPAYDMYTVYEASINNDNNYVLKKGVFKSEEELINEIKLQNRAAEFGLSDPIIICYILENGKEYGLIMKKYEQSLFRIFDSEYYDLEDKIKYVDRIKIILEDLVEKVKICHGDFNLDNIMVDEEDNLKLVDFGKGCFLDDDSKKNRDTDNFNDCNFHLDTITEQVTYDLQNYWYEIMK